MQPHGHRRPPEAWPAAVALAVVIVAAWLAWWSERPPAPVPADAPATEFSAWRARAVLEEIAQRPHPTGSAEHARVREWLVDSLRRLGLEVDVQQSAPVRLSGRELQVNTVRNIVARRRGTASTGGIALAAHYDSRELSPAAGDDGSGVAAILETVRALTSSAPLRNDLYVLITDSEEFGLSGARAFVAEHPWWPEISLLLNFEARGSAGTSAMFETNEGNGWIVREFARADPQPSGSSFYYEVYRRMPNGSDFSVFKDAGIAGLNFAFVEGADVYHRPSDTVENLSLASLQHHGEHALALARHFGDIDLATVTSAQDVVFFPLPRVGLVVYTLWQAKAFTLVLLVTAAVVAGAGMRRGRLTGPGVLVGFAGVTLAAALAAGLAYLMVLLLSLVHQEDGTIVGQMLYREGWYGLAVVAISVGSMATVYLRLRRRFAAVSLFQGALLLPLLLALLTPWLIPGASMLFLWPTAFAVAVLWHRIGHRDSAARTLADLGVFGCCAAVIVVVFLPLPYAIFFALSIAAAPILAIVLSLGLSLLLPLFEFALAWRWRGPAASYAIAIACLSLGLSGASPSPERPEPVSLNYVLDHDQGRAFWLSASQAAPDWLARFLGTDTASDDLSAYFPEASGSVRVAEAPLQAQVSVELSVPEDRVEDGMRLLSLSLRPLLGQELIRVEPLSPGMVLRGIDSTALPATVARGLPPDWVLVHRGMPANGVLVLDLALPATGGNPELAVSTVRFALPVLPGYPEQRPASLVAPGNAITDRSLFRQRVRID